MNIRQFFVGRAIGFLIVLIILGVIALFYTLNNHIYDEKQGYAGVDHKNAEYVIEGKRVLLVNGVAETSDTLDTTSKIITKYFGNDLVADLNGDGQDDRVFLLTQESGGTGIFFYVVAAVATDRGYIGSEAIFLGDRIAPQTTEKAEGDTIIINYADRGPQDPFTVAPSIAKTMKLSFDGSAMKFTEVLQNPSGAIDLSKTQLTSQSWKWMFTLYADGRQMKPKKAGAFALTFGSDGAFSAKTDCNSVGGKYTVKDMIISFSDIFSTKMFCEGSQEADFIALLGTLEKYQITADKELIFELKSGKGSAMFK